MPGGNESDKLASKGPPGTAHDSPAVADAVRDGPDSADKTSPLGSLFKKARRVERLTGEDLATSRNWHVGGTDLGIPYMLENGSVGFLFGDTFAEERPKPMTNWRSPVMLRSNSQPSSGIVFDSAARLDASGAARQLMDYSHSDPSGSYLGIEITRIPNDAVSFPETGRQVLSYMSVYAWPDKKPWRTRYAGMAWSDNGNDFFDSPTARWGNNVSNSDPFQMWTMQLDGDYVYVFSVAAGRQRGPMMLRRVPWQQILEPRAYEPWGWQKNDGWGWGNPCTPILSSEASARPYESELFEVWGFGEPSVRRLRDGVWAMSYSLPGGRIVTRTAEGPNRPWSKEKVQLTYEDLPDLYGGFIHPYSTSAVDGLHLIVSTWQKKSHAPDAETDTYHVEHWVGTL
jgi:hypothetical protein